MIIYKTIKAPNDADILQKYLRRLHQSKNGRNTGEWNLTHLDVIAFPLPVSGTPPPISYILTSSDATRKIIISNILGVTLLAKLSWSEHVTSIVSKANRALGMTRRNINVAPMQAKSQAYQTLVRPHLE